MADVEDRGSAIRVERLTAIPVGAKGYVKIETNMGVTGWGEINNMNTKVACALAESLGEVVIGENPTRIEHLWQRMFRAHRNLRGGGFMMHVISRSIWRCGISPVSSTGCRCIACWAGRVATRCGCIPVRRRSR